MDKQDLRECPFCGGEAIKCENSLRAPEGLEGMHWIICKDCHASPGDRGTEAEAIAAWNTRAIPASSDHAELVERLREKNGRGDQALGYHPLINPDGPEAAAAILSLEARVKQARIDALEEAAEVAEACYSGHADEFGTFRSANYEHAARKIAQAIRNLKGEV